MVVSHATLAHFVPLLFFVRDGNWDASSKSRLRAAVRAVAEAFGSFTMPTEFLPFPDTQHMHRVVGSGMGKPSQSCLIPSLTAAAAKMNDQASKNKTLTVSPFVSPFRAVRFRSGWRRR